MTRPAPYPSDVRSKGWQFGLDMEQFKQSDTWLRARTGAMRGLLLLLWGESWMQTPCGSLPNDHELIALMLGMDEAEFAQNSKLLLSGWWLADDGRLYHDTITERVLGMMAKRRSDSDRQSTRRSKSHMDVTRDTGVNNDSLTRESSTGTGTGTDKEISNLTVAPPFRPENGLVLEAVESKKPKPQGPPDCPHQDILALWAEVLPALPQHLPEQWRGARADHLRARWRETATAKGWKTHDEGREYFRRLFAYVGQSQFLTGRAPTRDPTKRPFVIELEWLVNPSNWAKVHEGKYHPEAA